MINYLELEASVIQVYYSICMLWQDEEKEAGKIDKSIFYQKKNFIYSFHENNAIKNILM